MTTTKEGRGDRRCSQRGRRGPGRGASRVRGRRGMRGVRPAGGWFLSVRLTQRPLLCLLSQQNPGWLGRWTALWVQPTGTVGELSGAASAWGPGRARGCKLSDLRVLGVAGPPTPQERDDHYLSPGAQMSRPPRSWAWREICWGQKPPQSYYVPGWRGAPRSRRSRHPHQAKSLARTHQEGTPSLGRLPPMPTSCPSCKQPSGTRVCPPNSPRDPLPTTPVCPSRGLPEPFPHPPRGAPPAAGFVFWDSD